MRILIAIAVLAAAGCSKQDSGGGKSPCETAVARGVEQTIAKRRGPNAGEMSEADKEVPAKLAAVLTKACTEDKWASDVIDCFKTAEDIKLCKDKLTPEQRASYTRSVMQVMMSARQQGGMGHGGPMTGSGREPAPGSAAGAPEPAGSGAN